MSLSDRSREHLATDPFFAILATRIAPVSRGYLLRRRDERFARRVLDHAKSCMWLQQQTPGGPDGPPPPEPSGT